MAHAARQQSYVNRSILANLTALNCPDHAALHVRRLWPSSTFHPHSTINTLEQLIVRVSQSQSTAPQSRAASQQQQQSLHRQRLLGELAQRAPAVLV